MGRARRPAARARSRSTPRSAPGTLRFTIELDASLPLVEGTVFDGTARDFALRSGGLRDRLGLTVVTPGEVPIGKLKVRL